MSASRDETSVGPAAHEPAGVHQAMQSLAIDATTAEVFMALRAAGIPSILLKGPSVARWLYGPSDRTYVDCDLLAPSADLEAAAAVLAGLGFERRGLESIPNDWPRHAANYRRGNVWVDLHHTLLGVTAGPDRFWEVLARHREPMRVGGQDVDVLDPAGRALVLALHVAKDGGRVTKPVRDLERALAVVSEELWREAAAIAAEVGAVEAFAAGLRRLPAGEALASRLTLSSRVSAEVALREESAPALSVGMHWLLRSRGVRGKAGLVARKLFPPQDFLRDWSSLARRGRVGLVLAYVWRPIWVAWRAVPALAAVMRARLKARRSEGTERAITDGRLPIRTKLGLVVWIWWTFAEVGVLERRLPLPQLTRRLAVVPTWRGRLVDPGRLGRIVGRVLRVGRWTPRCLFSALVLYRLLRRQGRDAQLVIGMLPSALTKEAHAWVEVDGVDVGPPPGARGRRPLARYP